MVNLFEVVSICFFGDSMYLKVDNLFLNLTVTSVCSVNIFEFYLKSIVYVSVIWDRVPTTTAMSEIYSLLVFCRASCTILECLYFDFNCACVTDVLILFYFWKVIL